MRYDILPSAMVLIRLLTTVSPKRISICTCHSTSHYVPNLPMFCLPLRNLSVQTTNQSCIFKHSYMHNHASYVLIHLMIFVIPYIHIAFLISPCNSTQSQFQFNPTSISVQFNIHFQIQPSIQLKLNFQTSNSNHFKSQFQLQLNLQFQSQSQSQFNSISTVKFNSIPTFNPISMSI
jgi:hypothetical protein